MGNFLDSIIESQEVRDRIMVRGTIVMGVLGTITAVMLLFELLHK